MNPGRYGLVSGVSTVAWVAWFVGGLWFADRVYRALGVPLTVAWLAVWLGCLAGVPVWLICRTMDR